MTVFRLRSNGKVFLRVKTLTSVLRGGYVIHGVPSKELSRNGLSILALPNTIYFLSPTTQEDGLSETKIIDNTIITSPSPGSIYMILEKSYPKC